MIYLLIKVCVNKALIHIKSNIRTLKISSYSGKDKVCLHGGIGFKSCPMHVNKYFNILFIYVLRIGYIILCFSRGRYISFGGSNNGYVGCYKLIGLATDGVSSMIGSEIVVVTSMKN